MLVSPGGPGNEDEGWHNSKGECVLGSARLLQLSETVKFIRAHYEVFNSGLIELGRIGCSSARRSGLCLGRMCVERWGGVSSLTDCGGDYE